MIFNYDANKPHFHNKGFAPSLVLRVRFCSKMAYWQALSYLDFVSIYDEVLVFCDFVGSIPFGAA